jgi:hypothetical protein
LTEKALLAIYHANQERTWNESLIAEVEDALDRASAAWPIIFTTRPS